MKIWNRILDFFQYVFSYGKNNYPSPQSVVKVTETHKKVITLKNQYEIDKSIILSYQGNVDRLYEYAVTKMMFEMMVECKKNELFECRQSEDVFGRNVIEIELNIVQP